MDFGIWGGTPKTSARFAQIFDSRSFSGLGGSCGLDFALWGAAPENSARLGQIIDI